MYKQYLKGLYANSNEGDQEKLKGGDNGKKEETSSPEKETFKAESYIPEKETYKEEVVIPMSRAQIRQEMVSRGNDLQTRVDFKVTIKLSMSVKKSKDGSKAPDTKPVYWGDMSREYPPSVKVVRIFTSSTFTDTKHERNFWMEEAYPKIKSFCLSHGYEFQVVDMRWGVRDQATDDHKGTELCLRELEQCQKLSTGPNFISLLSHKYGYTSLPRDISAEEFEQLLPAMSPEQKSRVLKWYIRDDNAVPPLYILQSISRLIPDYISRDIDKKKSAKSEWWEESQALQEALVSSATQVLGKEGAMKYIISITHLEVQKGLLQSPAPESHCLWFKRTIEDIENVQPSYQLSRFIECLGPDEKWQKSRQSLNELKNKDIPSVLPSDNILSYSVPWREKGIDPEDPGHYRYLKKMTSDFTEVMCNKIERAIQERRDTEVDNNVYEECLRHMKFCREKANVVGRDDILEKMKAYILGESNQPLVVHGPSGIGKTSLMAMAACKVKEWTSGKAAVIMRFIGTTFDSSHIHPFMKSILIQLKHAQKTYAFAPEDMKGLLWEFNQSLNPVKVACPVVFIFDALDQFDTIDDARKLYWLPNKFPPNIKIIVSTIGDPIYECFPNLKDKFSADNYIEVPPLNISEVDNILRMWFMQRQRTVTDEQFSYLVTCYREQPLALYLKLAFDEARRWTSYIPVDSIRLEKTIRASVLKLFDYLEQSHGKLFVSHALGYLTLAQTGLSEAELDDILSCDDDVLNEVYVYWTPPIRRLPPLLLVRLRSYLMNKQYLVERGSDGIIVFNWYHRQFVEAARERYCSDSDKVSILHNVLAEFFNGTWANGVKKPFTDSNGVKGKDDRRVASQPIKQGDGYNKRKLNNLPYHRIKGGDAEKLKEECLFNYEFLLAKIKATSLRRVHEDFDLASSVFPEDKAIQELTQVLRLSEKALVIEPYSLSGQIVNRLGDNREATTLKNQCVSSNHPFILSNKDVMTKPGEYLKYVLTGHEASIQAISMTKDGKEVATVSYDNTLRTWDMQNGTELKKVGGLGQRLDGVSYLNNDQAIMVKSDKQLTSVTRAGDWNYTVTIQSEQKGVACFSVCGPLDDTFARIYNDDVSVHEASTGIHSYTVELPTKMIESNKKSTCIMSNSDKRCYGSEKFVAFTNEDNTLFSLLNLLTKSCSDVVYPFKDEEDKENREIDYMVITRDDKFVIVTCSIKMNFVFYDTKTLTLSKTVLGNDGYCFTNFHTSIDGRYLYYADYNSVSCLDFSNDNKEQIFSHRRDLQDVITADMKTFAAFTNEKALLVFVPGKNKTVETKPAMGTIMKLVVMPNARYVVLQISMKDEYFIQVFDLVRNEIVRQTRLDQAQVLRQKNTSSTKLHSYVDAQNVVISVHPGKLKLLNICSMKFTTTLQGHVSTKTLQVRVVCQKRVISFAANLRDININDSSTGELISSLEAPAEIKRHLDDISCNQYGEIAVVNYDDNKQCCVYNMRSLQLLDIISFIDLGFSNCSAGLVSPCDTTLAFSSLGSPRGYKKFDKNSKENKYEFVVEIWNLKEGKHTHQLFDRYGDVEAQIMGRRPGCSVYEYVYIDDQRIATSLLNGKIIVWNVIEGTILKRLMGHDEGSELFSLPTSPYLLSYNSSEEEESFKLWDKETLECLITHTLDEYQHRVSVLETGLSFVTSNSKSFVHWTVHGTGKKERLEEFPLLFDAVDNSSITAIQDDTVS